VVLDGIGTLVEGQRSDSGAVVIDWDAAGRMSLRIEDGPA
jgi:hypothetical protein